MKHELNEASISRLWKHTQERNIGIVTAFRGRYTKQENLKRNAQLRNDIRAAGYGFYTIEGHYIEGYGSEASKDVKEQSFLVIGDKGDDSGRLKGFLKKAGAKYNQDSIFYKKFDDTAVLIGTKSKDEDGNAVTFPGKNTEFTVGKFQPMKMGQFYSKMRGKPFVFESYEEAQGFFEKWLNNIMTSRLAKQEQE